MLNNASTYDSFSEACSNTTAAQGHDWIWPGPWKFLRVGPVPRTPHAIGRVPFPAHIRFGRGERQKPGSS